MQVQFLLLLPMVFLLPPEAWAGEIIGGKEAKPHSRPYMAFLRIQDGDDTFRCGGFLVAENFVLTAAHCQGEKISVTLGAHDIKKKSKKIQVIPVSEQIQHPEYNDKPHNNDIMLLKLEKAAKLSKEVDTLPLSCIESAKVGAPCSIAGWGRTSAKREPYSDELREVNVKVLEDSKCRHRYYNASSMMCAGCPGKDSALGDSGGPLVCGKTVQGIVSWGIKKGNPSSVYTRVSTFIPWIRETMRKLQH